MRLKAKRKQETGKRGPMKAVVPVDSMTRAGGPEKKGEQAEARVLKANSGVTSTPKSLIRSSRSSLNHETETTNTPVLPARSCQKKAANPSALSMIESRTVAVKKDGSGVNRSFTALSSTSCVPVLRRANSLTSGIPSLASPSVFLNQPSSYDNNSVPVSSKENPKPVLDVQPTTPVRRQSCQIPTLGSHQKSKSSSTIPQFNLSGLAVTSTPARNDRYTSPNHSTLECLPSPISVRDNRESSSLQTGISESVKTVDVPRNTSADGSHQKKKTISIYKNHGRSKSASNIQPPRDKRKSLTENHSDRSKIHVSSDNSATFDNDVKKDRSKSPGFRMGLSKPLVMKNLNNHYVASKDNQKKELSHASGNDQRKAKTLLQIFSKLKRSAAMPIDKENVNPSCEIHL
ncbi:hypothetical protein L798_10118 [Zootermopsis nevadensis]|uniref:Uncharacterized protein n=2 Tax=Zootermopsis nevadensis TaxID=136037 RepID=A0A067R2Q4_ZOONE|nr:hypothetical protein L798_10118 [Zootermopsis nevadensis]